MSRPRTKCAVPLVIELTDIITPKSCSSFIAELIKYLAFNKQQIPFPFERLKMFVIKRRERVKNIELSLGEQDSDTSARLTILMEKYYKKIEEAFETLYNTFKCIENELLEKPVEEVVLLFGATPVSPKDIYRFKIPTLTRGHSESQHVMKRQIANLFRNIILSDEVNTNLQRRVGLTNMFVMVKVRKDDSPVSDLLLPKDHYQLSQRAQQVCFTFATSGVKPCTCLPHDSRGQTLSDKMAALSISEVAEDQFVWFQVPKSLKGFKDCKSAGYSMTDLWYRHGFI